MQVLFRYNLVGLNSTQLFFKLSLEEDPIVFVPQTSIGSYKYYQIFKIRVYILLSAQLLVLSYFVGADKLLWAGVC